MDQIIKQPKVSIIVPIHDMDNGQTFLWRLVNSLTEQTFTDWELIITKEGEMAENTNAGILRARGEIIKILYLDDRFAHKDSLQMIVDAFTGGWLVSGCLHDDGEKCFNPHIPSWDGQVSRGYNTIGSPSVLAFENSTPLLFNEKLTWVLDCELYGRLFERYGEPTILKDLNIVIGVGAHQMTNKISDERKQQEHGYIT